MGVSWLRRLSPFARGSFCFTELSVCTHGGLASANQRTIAPYRHAHGVVVPAHAEPL